MSNRKKLVIVAGDLTMDWNLARLESFHDSFLSWSTRDTIRASLLEGGACLLAELVRSVCTTVDRDVQILPEIERVSDFSPENTQYHHSYAIWSLFNYEEKASSEKADQVWRVDEFLGLQHPKSEPDEIIGKWKQLVREIPRASLVILDDAGLGFRDCPEIWKKRLSKARQLPWIILKMSRPVAQGKLWKYLVENFAERLIVVIPVNDLRLTQAKISRELSWERTAEDLAWELTYSTEVSSLSKCAHVVISFDGAGVLLFSKASEANQGSPNSECTLFFESTTMEGMWTKNRKGGMIGYTSCLVSAIARQLLIDYDSPDIKKGIHDGLGAIQTLHKEGYGKRGVDDAVPFPPLAFPFKIIADKICADSDPFVTAKVPVPVEREQAGPKPASQWTILQQKCAESKNGEQAGIYPVAAQIVRKGLKATVKDVPLGQFGDLITVDRNEIEGFRSIAMLIREYLRQRKAERPLSIAVFGAPGSGKSFGISEVAKSISPDEIKKLTFNLSQFSAAENLLGAFHQVRDIALSGKVPLVFWDEFDSSLGGMELGWLRYFLSPMQDGTFQEGEITHPIGRSIFVFAGGTTTSREEFNLLAKDHPSAKVSDFLSRLKGHLRVMGPNPEGENTENSVIRRAILLRSVLERFALQIFRPRDKKGEADLDKGVLRAFLRVPKYKHGARSIESIVAMSSLTGKNRFERSSLPPEEQLDLHVNGRTFLALVQQVDCDEDGQLLEELAEQTHNYYCASARAAGIKGPHVNQTYAALPNDIKQQNRDQVRDMQTKLEIGGYIMIPARRSDPVFAFDQDEISLLAQKEHDRWMNAKIKAGWRYAAKRNDGKKLHPDLLAWGQLSEEAAEKDRESVRRLPDILARAGYTIVKVTN